MPRWFKCLSNLESAQWLATIGWMKDDEWTQTFPKAKKTWETWI